MKKTLVLILSIIVLSNLSAQQTFTKQELLDDIDSLYVMINEVHPEMFAYIERSDFEKKLLKIKNQLPSKLSRLDFYLLAQPLVSMIGDGHTSISFPWHDIMADEFRHFPLRMEFQDFQSKPRLTMNLLNPNCNIPAGSKIISINGKQTTDIANNMFHLISGEKDYYKISTLNNMFWAFHSAIYRDTTYIVEYMYNGKPHEIKLEGHLYRDIALAINSYNSNDLPQNYFLTINEQNKIAVIHFNRFYDYDNFKTFLDSSFTIIHENKINDLIIDIRNNGGGHSALGDELFQYISHVPFQQYGKVLIKNSNRQAAYHREIFDLPDCWEPGIETYYVDELHELRENDLRFSGNTYLLTSHFTFSSAADFAWAFKHFEMGKVIGEETGGLAVCFGDIIVQKLPNTNLQLNVSHKLFYNYGATDKNTHGTMPDYAIPADEAMDFAIDLILQNRKQTIK